jgi:hypothetical protein
MNLKSELGEARVSIAHRAHDSTCALITVNGWEEPRNLHPIKRKLPYQSAFPEAKLKCAILKAAVKFGLKNRSAQEAASFCSCF